MALLVSKAGLTMGVGVTTKNFNLTDAEPVSCSALR
jgi:hypothetical protein